MYDYLSSLLSYENITDLPSYLHLSTPGIDLIVSTTSHACLCLTVNLTVQATSSLMSARYLSMTMHRDRSVDVKSMVDAIVTEPYRFDSLMPLKCCNDNTGIDDSSDTLGVMAYDIDALCSNAVCD